jgi:hypothetical protein
VKVVWGSSSGQARDGREICGFFFLLRLVCRSCSASERRSTKHRNTGTTLTEAEDTAPKMCGLQAKNPRKIGRKSTKILAKSTKNRRNIDVGPFWALKTVLGTRPDALRTACGRPNVAQRPILRRPERAKSGQETSKSVPGSPRRRSRTASEQCQSAFGASSIIERACGVIFHRFCIVARKLRSAFRIGFYSTFSLSLAICTERARATKKLENSSVLASKSEPGSVRATQNRVPTTGFERQNAKKSREAHRFFFLGANGPVGAKKRARSLPRARKAPNAPEPRT